MCTSLWHAGNRWGHEIEDLQREDALSYYRRFYRPDNAILIVAGDVDAAEVRSLAETTMARCRTGGTETAAPSCAGAGNPGDTAGSAQ